MELTVFVRNSLRLLLSIFLPTSDVVVGWKRERTPFVDMCLGYCLARIKVDVAFST